VMRQRRGRQHKRGQHSQGRDESYLHCMDYTASPHSMVERQTTAVS
jgi:hypothetical protein